MMLECQSYCTAAGRKIGALLRRHEYGRTHIRLVHRTNLHTPLVVVDQSLTYNRTARTWQTFTYHSKSEHSYRSGYRSPRGTISLDAHNSPALTHGVPGFAEYDLLAELLRSDAESLSFKRFDEARPHTLQDAVLIKRGSESVTVRDGARVAAYKVELVVNGDVHHTHWCCGQAVARTQWQDNLSFSTHNMTELTRELHPDVVLAINEFMKRPVHREYSLLQSRRLAHRRFSSNRSRTSQVATF